MENEHKRILEENYNLSKREASIYLSMIKTGYSSILKISKVTEIKRSTVYITIEGLITKGLVKTIIRGKKKFYLPESPDKMISSLESRKLEIEKISPILKDVYLRKTDRPIINFYEGKQAIRNVYKEALSSQKETLWFGSARDMKNEFPEFYDWQVNIRRRNTNFEGMRDIVNNTKADRDYAFLQNSKKDSRLEVRILPQNLFFPDTDNIIFGNKLAILSIRRDFFATVIENTTVVNAYRCIFELAWSSAKKIKSR